jgi:hypothetical protein
MKAHILSESEWETIRNSIRREYGDAMILIRERMQRELGFTPRRHRVYDEEDYYYYRFEIHIDFYTEEARTWFLMKYV